LAVSVEEKIHCLLAMMKICWDVSTAQMRWTPMTGIDYNAKVVWRVLLVSDKVIADI